VSPWPYVQFYIAYLRQIKFPVGKAVKCEYSCLDALQIKLFIIFTGKTYGQKVLEYGKPLLGLWWRSRVFRKLADKAHISNPAARPSAPNALSGAEGAPPPDQARTSSMRPQDGGSPRAGQVSELNE
jgi:hypothetical protein